MEDHIQYPSDEEEEEEVSARESAALPLTRLAHEERSQLYARRYGGRRIAELQQQHQQTATIFPGAVRVLGIESHTGNDDDDLGGGECGNNDENGDQPDHTVLGENIGVFERSDLVRGSREEDRSIPDEKSTGVDLRPNASGHPDTGVQLLREGTSTADPYGRLRVADGADVLAVAREVDEMNGNPSPSTFAVNYDPDATPKQQSYRFQLYGGALLAIGLVVAIGATVGAIMFRKDYDDNTSMRTEAPTTFRESLGIREQIEQVVLVDGGAPDQTKLDDPNSPYSKALDWITFEDPMQLLPESPSFIQRYIAIYLYFATTARGPWRTCNPPPSGDSLNSTAEANTCAWLEVSRGEDNPTHSTYIARSPHHWLSNITECKWAGISCDGQDQIIKVELAHMGLSGTFPEGIYNWPFLQEISFSSGYLHGPLPTCLVEMSHIVSIVLGNNQFTGSIPNNWWAAKNLQEIYISLNKITGTISTDVGNAHDLKYLELGHNELTGVLPSPIGLLQNLVFLDVSRNNLHGEIPPEITNCNRLDLLWLHQNNFGGSIPSAIGNLVNLEDFRVHTNPRLTGTIPESMYMLTNLVNLDIFDCSLSGTISSSIGVLGDSLEELRISNNRFHGPIPSEFSRMTNLIRVWLQGNDFSGSIPKELCNVKDDVILAEFKADCVLGGEVPHEQTGIECKCCTHCCTPRFPNCLQRHSSGP